MSAMLTGVVADYVNAVNTHDTDAIVALFAPDAYVNDARREIVGAAAIRSWIAKEIVGDNITMDARKAREHYGEVIVSSRYDGTFDKANLPEDLVLTDYFRVLDGKIVSLTVILNQPSPY